MAIAQPTAVMAQSGQDLTWTVSLSPAEDVTGWTVTCTIRAYNGGTALVTKTIGSGITVSDTGNGIFVVAFSASDLTLTHGPGAYVIGLTRTNAGFTYPITDPSPFILRPANTTDYPTLTNLGEYNVHALGGITLTDAMAQQLVQLLFAAESRIKRYCGRDFVYRALATEYYDGNGSSRLRLRRTPIVPASVVIYEDYRGNYGQTSGSFDATNSVLTLGENYSIAPDSPFGDGLNYSGIVERIAAYWPMRRRRRPGYLSTQWEPCPGSVKVTYSGGYTLIPYDLKKAVWDLTSYMESGSVFGQIPTSESGEGYSRSFGGGDQTSDIPVHIRAVLDSYRDGASYVG